MARPDGTPKDVDREFVNLYMAFNESQSWYLDHNIQTYTTDPKGVKTDETIPLDEVGHFFLTGSGFAETAIKWSINGYIFGNMPMMAMQRGQHVRWYLVTLGDGFNFHTPHWHGNVVTRRAGDGRGLHLSGADGYRGHGSGQDRSVDVSLPRQRPHGGRHDDGISGAALDAGLQDHADKGTAKRWPETYLP